ncbi:MAG: dicarboxylate/amino acid:cation symporter [Flavobacteriales bacterium]|jgi:Na+/H+-dicarboxylate symporter|nr:dicarboxylate/amino acid:cation symporter [Flavobacteriales bacterium]|tara:strand:- start:12408 stop:13679 length:1272 start_codon:yes stop_codon:yes gene_type:complete
MKKISLHWKILIAMLLGVFWALLSENLGDLFITFNISWFSPFGTIFLKLLKLIAVPLVLFSIIKGVSGLSNISALGKMGIKTISLYLITTLCSVTIGLFLVNQIGPGEGFDFNFNEFETDDKLISIQEQVKVNSHNSPLQFLVNMVPDNIFYAMSDNKAMLQIIFFALFFSVVLILIDSGKKKTIDNLIDSLNEVFLKMVDLVIKYSPFFIFCLLAGNLSELSNSANGSLLDVITGLALYTFVVLLGLLLMLFCVYPMLMKFFTKNFSYRHFFQSIAPAQILAFSTSSSAATLPVTMDCVNNNLKVPDKVTSFVLPIGATINMDGTSLYQCVAVVFLAQILDIDLSLSTQILIALTAVLASIGSAAIPSAGLFMLIVVLGVTPIDPKYIAIIFPVDRILDMCRTVINVTGDATVSSIVAASQE